MILSPLLGSHLRPTVSSWLKQTRNLRPSIKIGKDSFQISLDVHKFNKDEIRVKARPEYVMIEGKQELKTKQGFIMRQFVKKFKLPRGCKLSEMESKLSNDGILTITAPRNFCEMSLPLETVVPISYSGPRKEKEEFVPVKESSEKDLCAELFNRNKKPVEQKPEAKKS